MDEYYKHPQMSDGYFNKCKECFKSDVISNRKKRESQYREYERQRAVQPKRAASSADHCRRWRKGNPRKYAAHILLNNAVRIGTVKHSPCEKCGNGQSHGHHENYDYPLNVVWLCAKHHQVRHREMKAMGIEP